MGYGNGFVYKRGRVWWMSYTGPNGRVRESSGSEKQEYASWLLAQRAAQSISGRLTVMGACRYLLEDYKASAQRSLPDVLRTLKNHIMPAFQYVLLRDLNSGQVEAYKADRITAGASAATVNRELSILRRSLELARRRHPDASIPEVKLHQLKEHNTRQGFLSARQYAELLTALPPRLRGVVTCGYYWGCRRSELLGDCRTERRKEPLRWTQVDLDGGAVHILQTKNGEQRELPIYNDALRAVFDRPPDRGSPYVFTRNGRPFFEFRRDWARACKIIGLPDLKFHDLRRSAIRNMVRAGVPAAVAMRISGHRTRSAFERYNIVNAADLAAAGEKLRSHEQSGARTALGIPADREELLAHLAECVKALGGQPPQRDTPMGDRSASEAFEGLLGGGLVQ